MKKNRMAQSECYVSRILVDIKGATVSQGELSELCLFWHFDTRKAVELWSKVVYRENNLFPLTENLKFGPLVGVCGSRYLVLLSKRAFREDFFEVNYPSNSHTRPQ